MTAEIAIMNKVAVALAADSAVTISGEKPEKVFTSVNKIFTLSKYHPVGIMVFGNASFMNVPWETVIKLYRSRLGKREFEALEGYAQNFIDFLCSEKLIVPEVEQERFFHHYLATYYNTLKRQIEIEIQEVINKKGQISNKEIHEIVSRIANNSNELWDQAEALRTIPDGFQEKLLQKFSDSIKKIKKEVFENYLITDQIS